MKTPSDQGDGPHGGRSGGEVAAPAAWVAVTEGWAGGPESARHCGLLVQGRPGRFPLEALGLSRPLSAPGAATSVTARSARGDTASSLPVRNLPLFSHVRSRPWPTHNQDDLFSPSLVQSARSCVPNKAAFRGLGWTQLWGPVSARHMGVGEPAPKDPASSLADFRATSSRPPNLVPGVLLAPVDQCGV